MWWADGSAWIEDCASLNGTLVNGKQVLAPVALRHGDIVILGDVVAQVEQTGGDPRAGRATPPPARPVRLPDQVAAPRPEASRTLLTETTRYLCAASHLDESFCQQVIREVVEQPYRALAPSYGVDVPTVAKHALAARRRRLIRDLALLAVLATVIGASLGGLLSAPGHAEALRLGGGSARFLLDALWRGLLLGLAAAWLIVAVERIARFQVLGEQLSEGRFDPEAVRAPVSRRARERLAHLTHAQHGNVVVFRHYEPFIGSGPSLGWWSFAVDLTKGRRDPRTDKRQEPKPFEAEDLYGYLAAGLRGLGLPGLHVEERLFVSGLDVWHDQRLLPDPLAPPSTSVAPAVLREAARSLHSAARTYLCVEAPGWRGQLVVTIFVRAARLRGSLFLEASSFALLPLKPEYYLVDTLPPRGALGAIVVALWREAGRAVPLLLASPVRVLRVVRDLTRAARDERGQRRVITQGLLFDYGAAVSIREAATGIEFRRYFLELDAGAGLQPRAEPAPHARAAVEPGRRSGKRGLGRRGGRGNPARRQRDALRSVRLG